MKILRILLIRDKVFLPVSIHPLLARELRESKRLQKFFNSLPESSRHQIDHEVREVKKEDTRLRRAQHAAEYLMEAMEAELDPPPLMRAAFRRNAQARQGWELMPQSHRRQYLIAIFRSRFPDTRAANLAFALLDAAQYADRHAGNATNPDVET
ncbi:MAG: YdeI/OmpD-associated family protein [Terriglobales bacterium]